MSNMRIGGLASGMDIDSIVKDMMRAEQVKVDKTFQNKVLLEWSRSAYNDINKMLAEFVLNTKKSFGLTQTSGGSIINKSVNSLDWIKGAKIAKENIADIKVRANAVNGSYNINVQQLASNWSAASLEALPKGDNLQEQFGVDKIDFTIATKNEAGKEQQIQIVINDTEAYIKKGDQQEPIVLEGKNISNMSLDELTKQINAADIGVTATYDKSIDRFFLQTNNTGESNTINITDNTVDGETNNEGFIHKLRLQDGEDNEIVSGKTYGGTDAVIDFGPAKGIKKSSNQFTINNIDFDLKATGATTIKIETDETAVVDKVQEFIDQYNKLVDDINDKLTEKRYRDFPPLTNEQRESMSDKEIELWEEKAKSGLLRNDQILSRTMQNIRSGLYEDVQGVMGSFKHLTDIGIETEEYSAGSAGGKLVLNEEKLRAALREDVDGVMELLFKEPDKSIEDEKEKRKNTGLISRMYGDMVVGMKEIITKAGPGEDAQLFRNVNSRMLIDFVTEHSSISMLDENITSYEKRILQMERRLMEKENSYWAKFTAMEKALSNMYSQSSWLAQQLGTGQM